MITNDFIIGWQGVLNKQRISTLNTQLLWILWNECIQCWNTERLGFTKHCNMTPFEYHPTECKKLNYRAFGEHLLMKANQSIKTRNWLRSNSKEWIWQIDTSKIRNIYITSINNARNYFPLSLGENYGNFLA